MRKLVLNKTKYINNGRVLVIHGGFCYYKDSSYPTIWGTREDLLDYNMVVTLLTKQIN